MRVEQRGGHQLRRLVRRIAEHDALVAGAFILVAGGVHAHRDIRGLAVQVVLELGIPPGETLLIVADILHRRADLRLQPLHRGLGATDLTGEDDAIGGDQRLAGDARVWVGGQEGVDDGVRNAIRDLVGMTFGDGFRGEEIVALVAHGLRLSSCRGATGGGPGWPPRCAGACCEAASRPGLSLVTSGPRGVKFCLSRSAPRN